MARSQYVYTAFYDSHPEDPYDSNEMLIGTFTVKHELITAARRLLTTPSRYIRVEKGELTFYRCKDGGMSHIDTVYGVNWVSDNVEDITDAIRSQL